MTVEPEVRVFAPQPEGPPLTLWADAARTASELRERSAADAEAYPAFDRKVRSLASFLSYLHAITPPDVKDPSLADALNGVKLGNAFRRLGQEAGPGGDARAADGDRRLRRGGVRERRGAGGDRVSGRPVHGDGPVVGRHDGRAARGLGRQRRRGARAVDDRPRRPGRARRGARERGPRVRRRDPHGVRGRRDPGRASPRDRRGARRRLRDRGARRDHRDRSEAHAHDAAGPGRDRAAPALAGDEHPDPRARSRRSTSRSRACRRSTAPNPSAWPGGS